VFRFMCGQVAQASHAPITGAGMNVFPAASFSIWWMIPGSVAMMNSFPGSSCTKRSRLEVEPTWSASAVTRSSHSGWAITFASGCRTLSCRMRFSEKISCTWQVPGQRIMSRPVCRMM